MRLEYPDPSQHLIWIPFSEFMKCKQINCGGFSIIYEATWIPSGQTVALKCLKDSQDISLDFLNEIKSHWVLFLQPQFLRCYGITQQPSTGEFMMVTQYAPNGDLYTYLQKHKRLTWKEKIQIIKQITRALGEMHKRDLIHGDLHSGNIMNIDRSHFVLGDVGLCGPAGRLTRKKEVYGVIPYVAPELFRGQSYSKKSDIYSFGILMWEIGSGTRPYDNIPHDIDLVKDIYRGKRPPIPFGTPSFYSELMKSCWDDNPLNRPDAIEISKTIYHWLVDNSLDSCMRKNSKKSHFGRLHNKKVTHPDAVYHSRLLDFKEIKEMRLRQYLSLNLPSTYDQDFLEEISQLESDTDNQSQPSQDVTNNLQPSRDDHNPRNTYNFTSNTRNSFTTKYLPRSKETYKISSPTRDIYSFLPHTPKQYNGSTTNISKSFEADKPGTSEVVQMPRVYSYRKMTSKHYKHFGHLMELIRVDQIFRYDLL
ncbi:kinase-like domain-containing protein [Gigaspora rosea]|uniref:Kinase-like domain-containing protein n=1 Tax=Gigaspora rosea TaxID=44941 RepID=A0A397V967_9GLOM|nr:kinase-like domain-containing protein [Gigaspora rosea]